MMADRNISEDFLNVLLAYLAEKPYKETFRIIAEIHRLPLAEDMKSKKVEETDGPV